MKYDKPNVHVVDHDDGTKDFIRHPDGRILLQTSTDKGGQLWVGFVDKTLLPNWPKVPSWYPVEQAVEEAIQRHYEVRQTKRP